MVNLMKLIIDLGNSQKKVAVFSDENIVFFDISKNLTDSINHIFAGFEISSAILASVIEHTAGINEQISSKCSLLVFDENTPVPIKNIYLTPETLGKDRLASIVAANKMYPGENVLVIDAGSCIKYDFVDSSAVYHGGAISPGLNMRLKALHTFTGKLPLIELSNCDSLIGNNTQQSILSGVVNGAIAEINGIVEQYCKIYPDLRVVLSGGDSEYLVNKLKNKIFAVSNIVLHGLKIILDYNDNLKKS